MANISKIKSRFFPKLKTKKRYGYLGFGQRYALILIIPSIALFLFFNIYPIGYTVYLAFTDAKSVLGTHNFIGLENFAKLFTSPTEAPRFTNALYKTLLFVGISVPLKVVVGVILALFFTSTYIYGRRLLRGLALTPWALPILLSMAAWKTILSPVGGPLPAIHFIFVSGIDYLIKGSAYNITQVAYVIARQGFPFNPLGKEWDAFLSYNMIEVWLAYPFIMTVVLGALASIPREMIEAALIDGASYLDRVKYVILPQIFRPLIFATLLTTGASFQAFMIPLLLNDGGPGRKNEVLLLYGYHKAFIDNEYGFATAIFLIVVVILAIYYIIALKITGLARRAGE
jgi:arabinogalactan oligomer/maltooligosaccharide transport system permease protein